MTMVARECVQTFSLPAEPESRTVALDCIPTNDRIGSVRRHIAEAVRDGAYVLWIRNTVAEAQEAWRALSDEGLQPLLFHARYRPVDRRDIENTVLDIFGSGTRDRSHGRVLIATQVVEQSLDLDFDWMISDLAPIDLLLQRAGRLHRHPRARPSGYEQPTLTVLVLETPASLQFGSSGHVYDEVTLYLTFALLDGRASLALPRDMRSLVEAVYDSAARQRAITTAPNREALEKEQTALEQKIADRRANAARVCIPPTDFQTASLEMQSDDEETLEALTRDGKGQRLWPVVWDVENDEAALIGASEPLDDFDPEAKDAWKLARAIQDQLIGIPAYDWKRIESAVRVPGDARAFEAWRTRAERFLGAMRLGDAVIVALTPRVQDGTVIYRGRILEKRGKASEQRRIAYSVEQGLWFPTED